MEREIVNASKIGDRVMGQLVQYRLQGQMVFFGIAEYLTADKWIGIRQADGRLDEAPANRCILDPT